MAISRQVNGGYELHVHACGGAGARHTCVCFKLMVFSEKALKSMCPHTLFSFLTPEKNISGVIPLQYSSLYNVNVDQFLIIYLFSAHQLPEDGHPPFSTFHQPWEFCPRLAFTIVCLYTSLHPFNNSISRPTAEKAQPTFLSRCYRPPQHTS